MKKRRTNSLLLFSALTVILCTRVKAPENSKNRELARALWNIKINHILGHQQNLKDQTSRENPTSAKFSEEAIAKFRRQYRETCQQRKAQEETDNQQFWLKKYQNPRILQNSAHKKLFFNRFLFHLLSQDSFAVADFDD